MHKIRLFLGSLVVLSPLALDLPCTSTEAATSTRTHRAGQHQHKGPERYPFRDKSKYILRELDLQPGDVNVDIGAGGGSWTGKLAKVGGESGGIHAAEVDAKKVEQTKEGNSSEAKQAKKSNGRSHTSDSLVTVKKRVADKTAVLIDVREQDEWDDGHLAGATLVPLSRLSDKADRPAYAAQLAKTLSKDKIIYCHCRSGGRVLVAAPILQEMGYDVRPLKAGYADLLKAGFPKANRQE